MKVYGSKWSIFWVIYRSKFWFPSNMEQIAKELWIELKKLYPKFDTSSTFIRQELIYNRESKPTWLNDKVYEYILENDLYIPNHFSKKEYEKYWNNFVQFVDGFYPKLNIASLKIPNFNCLQHKEWWKEKFIRYIVKEKKLEWEDLEFFVKNALNFEI